MYDKDLEKQLDYLIIDGLIKEAEQDNADFEAAMRKMSDEEFNDMVCEQAYVFEESYELDVSPSIIPQSSHKITLDRAQRINSEQSADASISDKQKHIISKWKVFRPWIISAVAAAAVVLIILIPSINSMNGKLCDSVLYASEPYITSSKGGFDVSSATINEIKEELPNLETRYRDCIQVDGPVTNYSVDLKDAGWDLTIAYLKLHKRNEAIKILTTLAKQYPDTPFGAHCKTMCDQLK